MRPPQAYSVLARRMGPVGAGATRISSGGVKPEPTRANQGCDCRKVMLLHARPRELSPALAHFDEGQISESRQNDYLLRNHISTK